MIDDAVDNFVAYHTCGFSIDVMFVCFISHVHFFSIQPLDTSAWKEGRITFIRPHESSALEIAAEQMRLWLSIDLSKRSSFTSVIYIC